jgi:hypothetical protein
MEKRLETKQMKLTKQTLKRIIKEELNKVMREEYGELNLGKFNDAYQNAYDHLLNKDNGFEQNALNDLEDKAAEAIGSSGDQDSVTFDYETYTGQPGDQIEPSQTSITIDLMNNGAFAIDGEQPQA